MRIHLQLALCACTVNFVWTALLSASQKENELTTSYGTEVRDNLQNLFDSIAKNETKRNGRFREIIRLEVAKGHAAFNTLGKDLLVARSSNANKNRHFSKKVMKKRQLGLSPTKQPDPGKPLFDALERNDESAARELIEEKGVPLTSLNDDDQTPAHVAARIGNVNILKLVLDKDPSILEKLDFHGKTVIYWAIMSGRLDVVKYLVETRGVDINKPHRHIFGNSAIHIAAEEGKLPILKYFVEERGGDVNIQNTLQQTPVMLAAEQKRMDVIKYLVEERNAYLKGMDYRGGNILYTAVNSDDLALLKYILDERKVEFDVNWKDEDDLTILHRGAIQNRTEIVKYLVEEKHADVNIPDKWGKTPLHSAARWDFYDVCKCLIENGADLEARDDHKQLPVHEAKDKRLIDYMEEAAKRAKA